MRAARALPPPAAVSSAETDDPRAIPLRGSIIAGLLVVLVTFGGFGTWAAMAPLSSAVVAEGVFQVSSRRKDVQHPVGGVVRTILVEDGERVEQDQVLLTLDDTQARATLESLQVAFNETRARAARLHAERAFRSTIHFPDDLVAAGKTDQEIKALLRNEEDYFKVRRQALTGSVSIIGEKITQLQQQTEGMQAQLDAKQREVALARDELDGVRTLFDDGLVEKTRVVSLEREVAGLEGEVGAQTAELARLAAESAAEELNIVQTYSAMREAVVVELREAETLLADLRARMREAEYTLENTVMRAPEDGVVMELQIHTIGGVLAPGATVLQLVPDTDVLVVEAKIAPADVDNLSLGQTARVQLTALQDRDLPAATGELVYLSADSVTDDASGQSHYVARVEIDPASLTGLGDRRLVAGMPVTVMLLAGDRTTLAYLAQPLLNSIEHAWREE